MANHLQLDNTVRLGLAIEVLQAFGEIRFVARGLSMLPSILPGDMIVVRKARMNEIRAGEVVLYARHDCFYAHRVIRAGGRLTLIARGDAMAEADSAVGESELLGRVTTVIRGLKTIQVTRDPGARIRLLRWVFRRSDLATRFLIRTYRFYARNSQKLNHARATLAEKFLECS
jgi:signal peptidase I